jgi:hypothetical protein
MPTEKITNGDFNSGGTGWTVNNPTGGTAPTFVGGSVSFNRLEESVYGDSIQQTFSAPIGSTQTVTMDLIESHGGIAIHTFQIDILDSGGTVIASHTYDVPNNSTVNVNFTFVPTTATSTILITNTTSTNSAATDGRVDNVSITCFAKGTMIETVSGPVAVEELTPGMLIETISGDFKPLRLALSRMISCHELSDEKLRPVRITAGTLGNGLPKTDLLVSRQHRMVVTSKIVQRMFGLESVLLPAIKLTDLPGIYVDHEVQSVEYFHLVFDDHEILFANGAPSESFYPGPIAIDALTDDARIELYKIFPKLESKAYRIETAVFALTGKEPKELVSRHLKNSKPLLQSSCKVL